MRYLLKSIWETIPTTGHMRVWLPCSYILSGRLKIDNTVCWL
jgi:hypothetical protein